MVHTAIIIPCYNEASRFPVNRYVSFVKKNFAASIYFVNDGSSDNTDSVLEDLRIKFPKHIKYYKPREKRRESSCHKTRNDQCA